MIINTNIEPQGEDRSAALSTLSTSCRFNTGRIFESSKIDIYKIALERALGALLFKQLKCIHSEKEMEFTHNKMVKWATHVDKITNPTITQYD